jgi:hypothetical protein
MHQLGLDGGIRRMVEVRRAADQLEFRDASISVNGTSMIEKTIFHRAFSGDERLWRVFWLLWIPFVVLVVVVRRTLIEIVPDGALHSSWLFYLSALFFGICATWCLVALWKCSSNVQFRVFCWLGRLYVVIRFIGLIQAAGTLLRTT